MKGRNYFMSGMFGLAGALAGVGCGAQGDSGRTVPANEMDPRVKEIVDQCYDGGLACWHNASRGNPSIRTEICDAFEGYLMTEEQLQGEQFGDEFVEGHIKQCELGIPWLAR